MRSACRRLPISLTSHHSVSYWRDLPPDWPENGFPSRYHTFVRGWDYTVPTKWECSGHGTSFASISIRLLSSLIWTGHEGLSRELGVEPDDDGGNDHHRSVVDSTLLVARGQSAPRTA
jgi:hypothetical protein